MDKLAIFNRIPATESQIQSAVKSAKDRILSGDFNPLDLEIQLKAMEETIKRIRADRDVKNYVDDEAQKYPEKTFQHGSVTFTKAERKTYDYTENEEWRRIKTLENQVAEERKVHEKKLKTGFVDSATGEIVEAITPEKVTPYLIIKFDN
jgi:hypothetical protein